MRKGIRWKKASCSRCSTVRRCGFSSGRLKSPSAEAEKQLTAELAAADQQITLAKLAQEKLALQKIEEDAQRSQIEFLKTSLALAKRNLDRLEGLSESLVSAQKREQQELQVDKTLEELQAAQMTLKRMTAGRAFAEKSAAAELAAAQAKRDAVKAADKSKSLKYGEELAKLQYDQTQIEAPAAGTVLKTFVEPGEVLASEPILQMADLKHMTCQAEVFETDIQCIREGQRVRVTSPAFPRTGSKESGIFGKVVRISRLVAAAKLKSLDPYAAADRHVVEVTIEFDDSASKVAGRFVNLQVQVEFLMDRAP